MRSLLLLLVAGALSLTVLSPAEAATRTYSVSSLKVQVYDGALRDWRDIDLSDDHEDDYVRIRGKITGGPVRGKSIRITATNTDNPLEEARARTVSLTSDGSFSYKDHPPRAGRIRYDIRKATSGRYRGTTRTTYVNAWAFFGLEEMRLKADPTQGVVTGAEGPVSYRTSDEKIHDGSRFRGYDVMYVVNGGQTLTADLSGWRCKKFTMHAGVSTGSRQTSGSYSTRLGSTAIPQLSGLRSLEQTRDKLTVPVKTTTSDDFRFTSVRIAVAAVPERADDPQTAENEESHATDIRFMVGLPKVFCTYPLADPLAESQVP